MTGVVAGPALAALAATSGASSTTGAVVVALKAVTLVLGGLITFFAAKAYRGTGSRPIGYLALGFGFVTLGSLLAGAAHQAFGAPVDVVLLIESLLVAIGFGIITFSLYSD